MAERPQIALFSAACRSRKLVWPPKTLSIDAGASRLNR